MASQKNANELSTPDGFFNTDLHNPLKASLFSVESFIYLRDRQNCLTYSSRWFPTIPGATRPSLPMHIETF